MNKCVLGDVWKHRVYYISETQVGVRFIVLEQLSRNCDPHMTQCSFLAIQEYMGSFVHKLGLLAAFLELSIKTKKMSCLL